jgi:hypothetical protein
VGEINDARPRLLPEGKMFFLGSKSSPNTLYLIDKNSPMASVKVKSASATPDTDNPGKAKINFSFSDEDAQRFGDLTQSLVGKGLAILVNWEVQSVPIVRSKITGSGQIVGNYTMEEATDIAARISVPEYPAQLLILSDPTATPASPAPAKVEDVRKAVETRHYSGIDEGLWNRLLCKFLVPVFDPATGEELSFAHYDKAKGDLSVRNLPDNLAVFELLMRQLHGGKPQSKPDQQSDAAVSEYKKDIPQYTAELRLMAGTRALVESFCAQLDPGQDIAHGPEVERAFATNNTAAIETFFKANGDVPDLELLSGPRITFVSSEDRPKIALSPSKKAIKTVMRTDGARKTEVREVESVKEMMDRYSASFREFCGDETLSALIGDIHDFAAKNGGDTTPMHAGVVMGLSLSRTDAPDAFGLNLYINNKEVTQQSRGLAFWKPIPEPEIFESPVGLRLDKSHPYKMGDWIVAVTKNRDPKKATLAVLRIGRAPVGARFVVEALS